MADLTLAQKQAIAIAEALGSSSSTQENTIEQTAPTKGISNKIAETISGGKYGSMQDFVYGGQNPSDSFFGKVGQIADTSGLAGLTGISKVADVPALGAAIGKNIPNVPRFSEAFPKVSSAISSAPADILGFMSNKNPEAYKTIYNINKEGNTELKTAVKESIPLGKKLYNDMIYNYARQLQLPHETAILAKDYTKGHPEGLGAWDLLQGHYKQFDSSIPAAIQRQTVSAYKPFNELSYAQKLKQATQAGVDTSVLTPLSPKTGQALSKSDLIDMAKWVIPTIPHALPLVILKSPRVSGLLSSGAGKAVNIADKGKDIVKAGYSKISPALDEYYQQLAGLLSIQQQ